MVTLGRQGQKKEHKALHLGWWEAPNLDTNEPYTGRYACLGVSVYVRV